MLFFFFFSLFKAKNSIAHLTAISQLLVRNTSIKFTGSFVNAGNAINIPALTQSRNFRFKNLRVNFNLDHLITNSPYLTNFNLNINNGKFTHFLNSPIFMQFIDENTCKEYADSEYLGRSPDISRIFYFDDCVNIIIRNSTFTRCTTNVSSGTPTFNANGGAIAIIKIDNKKGHLFKVIDCAFTECSVKTLVSQNGGGAIYAKNMNFVEINNCVFTKCNVSQDGFGGGVCVDNCDETTIEYSTFSQCYTPSRGNGGGIAFMNVVNVYTSHLIFIKCGASYYGGGIFCFNVADYHFFNISITDCVSENAQGSAIAVNIFDFNPSLTTFMSGQYLYVNECNNFSAIAFGLVAFSDVRYITVLNSSANYLIYMLFSYGNISFLTFKGHKFDKYYQIRYTDESTRSYPRKFADGITNPLLSIKCVLVKYENYNGNYILHFKGPLTVIVENLAINISVNPDFDTYSLAVNSYSVDVVSYDSNFTCLNTPATNFFSNSYYFSESNGFSETHNFTESNELPSRIITDSLTFSNSFQFTPERTTLFGNDAYGTDTDMGIVSGAVIAVILLIVLIIVIILCVVKSRQTLMMIEEKEVHDEFYFPDFENRNV